VICLVGGSTGLIGDPRPSAERVLKTKEQRPPPTSSESRPGPPFLDSTALTRQCASRSFVNNLDWTAPMSALDFLRDSASTSGSTR
jgi:tyrosyl-tRNA synthetase